MNAVFGRICSDIMARFLVSSQCLYGRTEKSRYLELIFKVSTNEMQVKSVIPLVGLFGKVQ
jgi:hypothetical protein